MNMCENAAGSGSVDGGQSSAAAEQNDLAQGAAGAALMERLRQSRPCNELTLTGGISSTACVSATGGVSSTACVSVHCGLLPSQPLHACRLLSTVA